MAASFTGHAELQDNQIRRAPHPQVYNNFTIVHLCHHWAQTEGGGGGGELIFYIAINGYSIKCTK